MKFKYHTRLNHDMVLTRRKSETKKNHKPMKAEDLARRVAKKTISKAKHYRGSFVELPQESQLWITIGNGTYPWEKHGVYDQENDEYC